MPVNAGIEFQLAQRKYEEATSNSEKIRALEEMYATVPKHKGTEKLIKQIKSKLSKLREQVIKARSKKGSGYSVAIKKEGAAQIVLVGLTNVGKSTLMQELTNAKPLIADYDYTTRKPVVATLLYHGVTLQLIEIPALYEGYMESEKGPSYMSIVRNANLVVVVLDGEKALGKQLKLIEKIFDEAFLKLDGVTDEEIRIKGIPCIVFVNKKFKKPKTKYSVVRRQHLVREIWKKLDLIYVFTKSPGKKKDHPPVAFKKGSTIQDLAKIVHKDFLKKLKYARVWGKSVKHNGANVGFDHVLKEDDIIELHLK